MTLLSLEADEDPRHSFDGEAEIVANIQSRHRPLNLAQAPLAFRHVDQEGCEPFDGILAAKDQEVFLCSGQILECQRQQARHVGG